jgi:hypothetical protein
VITTRQFHNSCIGVAMHENPTDSYWLLPHL